MKATYQTANGVKPRYDGQGTEFGAMHRDIGPGQLMFDIDGLSATVEMQLELRRQNEAFVEYRFIDDDLVEFTALFELKRNKSQYTIQALDSKDANSVARRAMARKLEARLFVVFATNGKAPFDFHEIDTTTGYSHPIGILYYDENNRPEKVKDFWINVLKLKK